ncbi:hypothetical protein Y032_0013g1939 [Ancylostoma ceylanicum]|uniref:Uncharacterized protein n=1 Tax=Ancylostoma ceylanicum TaxID=53326 RepID=A0A016VB89_9BILA|nr:hypothetical protein Y032_0013g1939 [Ancylostoma ceylanicum]
MVTSRCYNFRKLVYPLNSAVKGQMKGYNGPMTLRSLSARCVHLLHQDVLAPGCVHFLLAGKATPTLTPDSVTAKFAVTKTFYLQGFG